MDSIFTRLDTLAEKWVIQGRQNLNPKDLEEYERREWYDLRDSWERANRELRSKLIRFGADAEKEYPLGKRSPILRLEKEANGEGKLYLGLDSPEAKGYRIIELKYPDWLDKMMKQDPSVVYSMNLNLEAVTGLAPTKAPDIEQENALTEEFYKDLKEAGIPAFEPIPGVVGARSEQLKPEFLSRLKNALNLRFQPYSKNVEREEALVEQIKREHALAVGPPISPVTAAVLVGAPQPKPKYKQFEKVQYKGATYQILDLEFINGGWRYELSAPGVTLFEPENELTPAAAKPPAKFKKGDTVIYRQGAVGEEIYIVKTPEFEGGKWFYVMETPRDIYRRFPEDELVLAPSKAEVQQIEKQAAAETEGAAEEEEEEIPEEPEQTVYVVVLVSGGMKLDAKGKPLLESPEFVIEATTKEEYAKYGDFNDKMWLRPLLGVFGVPMLNEALEEGEIEYDAVEDNQQVWGNDWAAIRENLAQNPPPFNKYALFHVKWRPEDVHWTQGAADVHDIWLAKYTKDELLKESKRDLQIIAKIKGLSTSGEEGELIDRIAAFNPQAAETEEEEGEKAPAEWKRGMPLTDEQITEAKVNAISAIEDNWVARNALATFDEMGRDAAINTIKGNLQYWGQGGPNTPSLMGSPKGVWVTNKVMTPAEAATAPPTDVRLLTWGDLLNFILANRTMYEEKKAAPAEEAKRIMEEVRPVAPSAVAPKPPISPSSKAAAAAAPSPAPKPTKLLSDEQRRLLQAYFNTQLIRALGKLPSGASSIFLVEYQEVKTLPFDEARAAITGAADRFAEDLLQQQRARAVVKEGERVRPAPVKPAARAPGRRETEEEGEGGGVPMAVGGRRPGGTVFPTDRLGHGALMPGFILVSEERIRLWNVFCNRLAESGFNCEDYRRQFEDYIEKSQHLSMEDLQERFKVFVEAILAGQQLPPLAVWRGRVTTPRGLRQELRELEPSPTPGKLTPEQIQQEEANAVKRQRILIAHWAAVQIVNGKYYNRKPTMSDLYDEVVDRGVIDASIPIEVFIPAAREAIREIYNQPLIIKQTIRVDGEEEVENYNVARGSFGNITKDELEAFLQTE
jgi:hypothetical protein